MFWSGQFFLKFFCMLEITLSKNSLDLKKAKLIWIDDFSQILRYNTTETLQSSSRMFDSAYYKVYELCYWVW